MKVWDFGDIGLLWDLIVAIETLQFFPDLILWLVAKKEQAELLFGALNIKRNN